MVCNAMITRQYLVKHFLVGLALKAISNSAVGNGRGSYIRIVEELVLHHDRLVGGKAVVNKESLCAGILCGFP